MSEQTAAGGNVQTQPASQSTSLDLIAGCGSTSLVWRRLGLEKADVAQKRTVCKLCQKLVAAKDGLTTTVFRHLWTNLRTEYNEYETLRESAVRGRSKHATVPAQKHTLQTQQTLSPITEDMAPIQVVEKDGFKQLLSTFHPVSLKYVVSSNISKQQLIPC